MKADYPRYSDPGVITIWTGRPGSGKSNMALRYGEASLKKHRIPIITNIVMLDAIKDWPGVHVCTRMTDLLKTMCQYQRALVILDEAGIYSSSGAGGSQKERGQWEMFIKLSRKFGVATFWIDQRGYGSVPPTMRELCTYHIHKPGKTRLEMYYGFKGEPDSRLIASRNIGREDLTTIPYDHLAPGSFIIDLPDRDVYDPNTNKWKIEQQTIRDLFDYIANSKSTEIRGRVLEWLSVEKFTVNPSMEGSAVEGGPKKGGRDRAVNIRDVIFFILDKAERDHRDVRSCDIRDVLGLRSLSRVSNIKKEWKDKNKNNEVITGSGA